MVEILQETEPVARKRYDCDACLWLLRDGIDGNGYTRTELRAISRARKNNWCIVPGDKYLRQNNKLFGEAYTFKAIPGIHKICVEHDLYKV